MNKFKDIDRLAQSFFIVLISCSLMNDSYILLNDFFKNSYVRKKINYIKNICDISYNLAFNNYKNDNDGNIIIDKTNILPEEINDNGIFDIQLDSDIDDIFEEDDKLISKTPPIINSKDIPITNLIEEPELEVIKVQEMSKTPIILNEISETLSQTDTSESNDTYISQITEKSSTKEIKKNQKIIQ